MADKRKLDTTDLRPPEPSDPVDMFAPFETRGVPRVEDTEVGTEDDADDWGRVAAPERAQVPAGEYTAVVQSAEVQFSESGNEFVRVRYRILDDGPAQGLLADGAGGNLFYTQKAKPYTKERLTILLGEPPTGRVDPATDASHIQGRVVRIRVAPEEYNGQTSNRVTRVLRSTRRGSGSGSEPDAF